MAVELRSGCPINLSVEVLGDKWSLVVLRDIMFGNFRSYRELHGNSLEGIATNILANRLKHLTAEGFLTAADDPTHKQRTIYSFTEKAIALVPVMAALSAWGTAFLPVSAELAARARAMEAGGPELLANFMTELRHLHLGAPAPRVSALAQMDAAYRAAVAKGIDPTESRKQ